MNENNIKPVPNLYSMPSNPTKGDCFYSIPDDVYYIYNGTLWLTPEIENREYGYRMQYKEAGKTTPTIQDYSSYDALVAAIPNLENAELLTDVNFIVGELPDSEEAVLRPANENDNAFLLLNGEIIGEIYPKIIYNGHCISLKGGF